MAKAPKLTIEALAQRITVLEAAVKANSTTVNVELPAAEDVKDMSDKDVITACTQLGIKTEGKKPKALKPLLVTVAKIGEGEKISEDEALKLCKALAIKPGKKLKDNIALLSEYLNADSKSSGDDDDDDDDEDSDDDDDDEDEKPAKGKKDKKSKKSKDDDDEDDEDDDDDSDDDEDDSDSDDDDDDDSDDDDDADDSDDDDDEDDDEDEDEKKSSKKSSKKKASKEDDDEDDDDEDDDDDDSSDDDDDDEDASEVDSAAVVKKLKKLPKEKVMKQQLDQFAKADPKAAKKFKGSIEEKYRSLLELLVGDDGEIAAWGEAYVRNQEGFCCGLPLKEKKVKGEKAECGQCLVTKTVFKFDDGEFEKLED